MFRMSRISRILRSSLHRPDWRRLPRAGGRECRARTGWAGIDGCGDLRRARRTVRGCSRDEAFVRRDALALASADVARHRGDWGVVDGLLIGRACGRGRVGNSVSGRDGTARLDNRDRNNNLDTNAAHWRRGLDGDRVCRVWR